MGEEGEMITETRISIRQQYSILTEVMETPAFKTIKLK